MLIEIQGGGFHNKGAHLMLLTAMAELRSRLPGARFCVESDLHHPVGPCAELGLLRLYPAAPINRPNRFPLLFRTSRLMGVLTSRGYCDQRGLARRGDPDALVDISGFAFGDAGPSNAMRNFAIRAASYRGRGRPVVLLPQMLGPFADPEAVRRFARIARLADVIYARDPESLAHALGAAGPDAVLELAPDITINDLHLEVEAPDPGGDYLCVVPNQQVLNHRGDRWREAYVPRLVTACRRAAEQGVKPVVVVHAGDGSDGAIGERVAAEADCGVELFSHEDPRVLKRFISGARGLVGSRFHAILAALSTGVPVSVIGWAHKYEMLLDDFGIPEAIHEPDDGDDGMSAAVDGLIGGERREAVVAGLFAAKAEARARLDAVWERVAGIVAGAGAAR